MKQPRTTPWAVLIVLLMLGSACKKKQEGEQASGSAAVSAESTEPAKGTVPAKVKKPVEVKELADAAEPTGVTWKRIAVPFGSLELPIDAGWNLVGTQVKGPDGIVLTLQAQDDIKPAQFSKYLAFYQEVQQREVPKYLTTGIGKGAVASKLAARVEGSFDNGASFVTRDFLIFTGGKVVVLGGRAPAAQAAKLPGLIDHVARSLQHGAAKAP